MSEFCFVILHFLGYTNLNPGTDYSYTVDLACSTIEDVPLSYSLEGYEGSTVPTWASIDPDTGILSFNNPDASTVSTYIFAISASLGSESLLTPISLDFQDTA